MFGLITVTGAEGNLTERCLYLDDSNGGDRSTRRYQGILNAMPNCVVCFDFEEQGRKGRKSAWLVPHVIRQKDDGCEISRRCSWGRKCESDCVYALARRQERVAPVHD